MRRPNGFMNGQHSARHWRSEHEGLEVAKSGTDAVEPIALTILVALTSGRSARRAQPRDGP
jgi:hypothetical protein